MMGIDKFSAICIAFVIWTMLVMVLSFYSGRSDGRMAERIRRQELDDKAAAERAANQNRNPGVLHHPTDTRLAVSMPASSSFWRHAKDGIYQVIGSVNIDSSDWERYPPTVVYQDVFGRTWCRPASKWASSMTAIEKANFT